jgi:tripartite-type tricarboxylate transporter receptor subunit TctC
MAKSPEIMVELQNMQIMSNYRSPADLKAILTDDYENPRGMAKKTGLRK